MREALDETFGVNNFLSLITFTKTTSATSERIAGVCDYLLLYAKDIAKLKYRRLFREKEMFAEGGLAYTRVELPNGTRRSTTKEERLDPSILPPGSKLFS
jgi:adenine-specific DNA-methyltransferase